MSTGNVVEIIGAVVDVQFPRGEMPNVYEALKIESVGLTLEVQQHAALVDHDVRPGLQRLVAQAAGAPEAPGNRGVRPRRDCLDRHRRDARTATGRTRR